jgi:phosphatidylglycerophosphate synthase
MTSRQRPGRDAATTLVAGLLAAGAAAVGSGHAYGAVPATVAVATVVGWSPAVLSAVALLRRRPRSSTPADWVTLTRAVLASACAAITVMVLVGPVPARTWTLLALTAPALLLDAIDGPVARRTASTSADGARLDMEVDAGLLVVLSLAASPVVGGWVVLIGAMRYLLVAASWVRPALRTPLPRSSFRRVVAGVQGVALAVVIAPFVPVTVATVVALVALGLLVVSFSSEIAMMELQARRSADAVPLPGDEGSTAPGCCLGS